MADYFYKGEDISLAIDIFEDEAMTQKVVVTEHTIEMLIYTSEEGRIVTASSKEGKDLLITTKDDVSQKLLIPSYITKELEEGDLTIEIKIIDQEELTMIKVISPGIVIANSKISQL